MSETFNVQLTWLDKNKNFTYNEYSREYSIQSEGKPGFTGTAAPAYKGLHDHYNPEDMLVASLSACHMLSYLALAANSGVQVLSYSDNADGSLIKDGMSMKFNVVTLRPKIKISAESDSEKAIALHKKAHDICFIGKSVNFEVLVEPEIV